MGDYLSLSVIKQVLGLVVMEGLKPYVHLPKGSCNLSQRERSDGGEKRELLPGEVPRSNLYYNWLNNQPGCSLN